MLNSIVRRATRKCTVKAVADRYRAANVEAAKIIIADPQYQGLMRKIAEITLAKAQAERKSDMRLADEGGEQIDLEFDLSVARGAA